MINRYLKRKHQAIKSMEPNFIKGFKRLNSAQGSTQLKMSTTSGLSTSQIQCTKRIFSMLIGMIEMQLSSRLQSHDKNERIQMILIKIKVSTRKHRILCLHVAFINKSCG